MKKLMCVLILVAFIGSMVVMTGCFGGSSGIAAILAGVLIIALIASGPSAIAFAANTRPNYRSALTTAAVTSDKYVAKITPTGRDPIYVYETKVEGSQIGVNSQQFAANSTNGQYLVEIFPKGYTTTTKPIFKYYFTKPVADSVTSRVNDLINASDTAKAMIYENKIGTNTVTMDQLTFDPASVNAVANQINNDLSTIITKDASGSIIISENFAWTTNVNNAVTTAETPAITRYNVTGYLTAVDGRGQDYAIISITKSGEQAEYDHTSTHVGSWSISLPNGTYVVTPSKDGHTYAPVSKTITVNGAAITKVDFQAAAVH